MIEKALSLALIALAVITAASFIGDTMSEGNEKLSCALDDVEVCIIDGKVGK